MPSARWALSGRGDDRRAKTPQPSKKWPFLPAFGGGRAFRDFLLQSPSALPHSHRRRASQVSIYLHGLMQAQPHAKNMERMEEAVAGADYDRLHHFIADSPWQAGPVMDHVACEVSQLLDGPNLLNYTSVSVQTWAAAFPDKAWETVALR